MHDVYENIDDYNVYKDPKILIVFDNMIADMIQNKKRNSIVTEFFIRGRKINISLAFVTKSYFKVPKDVRLNTTQFLIMLMHMYLLKGNITVNNTAAEGAAATNAAKKVIFKNCSIY